MIIVAALFVSTVILACSLFYTKRFNYWKDRNVPYVKPTFPYGNFGDARQKRHITKVFQQYYNEFKGKTPYVGLYSFLLKPVILITEPELIKHILIKDFNYFVNRGFYSNEKDDPLSAHLVSMENQKWRDLRSKLTPTFSSGKMKNMFPIITDVAEELKKCVIENIQVSNELDIKDILSRYTTDIIGTCAFGIECNSLGNPNEIFREMGKLINSNPRHTTFHRFVMGQYPGLARFFKLKINPDEVIDFFLNAVKETVQYREENQIKRNDFMDLLINLKKSDEKSDGLTIVQIAAQAYMFFLAGFDSSATAMLFTLYELALNPEIQEKVRQEIKDVSEKNSGIISYEGMLQMTYLQQVINETLRKYPAGASLNRIATKDYIVPNSDLVIKKGTQVFLPLYPIQHDPEYYPNPETFNPDNFSEDLKNKAFCYFPFGDGPRNCIGLRFGLMQMTIGLSTLIQNFRFSKTTEIEQPLEFSFASPVLTPKNKIYLFVEKI